MNLVDATVAVIVALSMTVGIVRGVVRELLYLAGWVLAFLLSGLYAGEAARSLIPDLIADGFMRLIVAHVFVFLVVLIAMATLAGLISKLVHGVGLGIPDRVAGGIYGALRGGVIVALLTLMCGFTRLPAYAEWRESASAPILETVVIALKPYLPQGFANRINFRPPAATAAAPA